MDTGNERFLGDSKQDLVAFFFDVKKGSWKFEDVLKDRRFVERTFDKDYNKLAERQLTSQEILSLWNEADKPHPNEEGR